MVRSALIILFAVELIGCATSNRINSVSIGMTKQEVISVLGPPTSISAKEGAEYLNYRFFETGLAAYHGITSPYFVRIINGKVESYGRLGDFDSTKDPTLNINMKEKK